MQRKNDNLRFLKGRKVILYQEKPVLDSRKLLTGKEGEKKVALKGRGKIER